MIPYDSTDYLIIVLEVSGVIVTLKYSFFQVSSESSLRCSAARASLGTRSAPACCWLPTVRTSDHESAAVILSSLADLSSPMTLIFGTVSLKSWARDGPGPGGLYWPQDVLQELLQRFWQGPQFPCNCLLMTCTAVRSGGNVLDNVTWWARLSL